jgi:hypothetical protein
MGATKDFFSACGLPFDGEPSRDGGIFRGQGIGNGRTDLAPWLVWCRVEFQELSAYHENCAALERLARQADITFCLDEIDWYDPGWDKRVHLLFWTQG